MLSLSDIVNVKVGIGRGVFEAPGATVIGGKKPSFNLEILKLFANGEQGFYQDPYDMGTMFQDAAGNYPVTAVGQPLGLVLDKSKGLAKSANLANVALQSPLSSKAILGDGNWWSVERDFNAFPGVQQSGFKKNTTYKVKISWKESTASAIRIEFSTLPGATFQTLYTASGTWVGYITSGDYTSLRVYFRDVVSAGYCGSINIEIVEEVYGNHAYQTTSSMRPLLAASPQRLDYDTIDDKLITNLPAQLTGCTVIRAIPSVGVQLLTGQTIPATYEDNKDHCGLIVINRALTPSETSAIAAEFNKRAGV